MEPKINFGNIITSVQMHEDELDYVLSECNRLPKDSVMVDWGSGGSTCLWLVGLKDLGQSLITIEHTELWYNKVTSAIETHFGDVSDRFTFLLIPEEYIQHGYGNISEEMPVGTREYINPELNIFDADVFFVDGIARGACLLSILLNHTKPNPVILIHDYVGRESMYDWATQFFRVEVVGTTLARLYIK